MIRAPIACLALASIAAAQSLNFARFDYPAGPSPARVAVGDFDVDGRLDVAAASSTAATVSILHGLGAGVLGAPVVVGSTPAAPVGLAAGDFDFDGDLDLASAGGTPSVVLVLRNDGTTPFAALAPIPVGAGPRWIAAADFDGAGGPDISTPNFAGKSVSVILSTAGGVLAPATSYALATEGLHHDVADVDIDGDLDLAVGRTWEFGVVKLANDGLGAFGPGAPGGGLFGWAEWVTLGDFSGDGVPDLVAPTNDAFDTLTEIYKGNVALGYGFLGWIGLGMTRSRLALVDGDALHDAVITSGASVAFHPADGIGEIQLDVVVKLPATGSAPVTADIDADGLMDVAVTVASVGEVSVLLQTAPAPPTIASTTPASVPVLSLQPIELAVHGSGFTTLGTVALAGVPAAATLEDDGLLTVELPNPVGGPMSGIGSVDLAVGNAFGITVVPLAVVAVATPTLVIANGAAMSGVARMQMASDPGQVALAAASLDLVPSSLPGIVDLGIGNGFTTLVSLGAVVVPAAGVVNKNVVFAGIPAGTQIHFQFAALDVPPALPLVASNVATGTVAP